VKGVLMGIAGAPADPVIREFHRFEGISGPEAMASVYAIESKSGIRGTVADAFGVYADPATAAVLGGRAR
jgi:hypothetical protein